MFVARARSAGTSGADAIAQGSDLAQGRHPRRGSGRGDVDPARTGLVATQQIFAGEQITKPLLPERGLGIQGQLKGTMRAYQMQGDGNQLLAGRRAPATTSTLRRDVPPRDDRGRRPDGLVRRDPHRPSRPVRAPSADRLAPRDSGVTSGSATDTSDPPRHRHTQAQKLDFTINTRARSGNSPTGAHATLAAQGHATPRERHQLGSVLLDGLAPPSASTARRRSTGGTMIDERPAST